jgi:hypothetical protein
MGGIAAQYRIGPSDLFSSSDLEADANTLKGQIEILDGLDWTAASQGLFDSWNGFLSDWKRFYNDTFTTAWFGAGWNDSNRDQLIQLERRFIAFAAQWQQESGQTFPGAVIDPSSGAKDTLGQHLADQLGALGPGAWSVTTIIVVIVVALVVWKEVS